MLVLRINCFYRQLISCSEDGSVRIWELREKQQLPAEPVPTGLLVVGVKRTFKKDDRKPCIHYVGIGRRTGFIRRYNVLCSINW